MRLGQLVLFRDERTIASIPCEDIGVVLVDQQQATYSHAVLAGLAESDAVLVCGPLLTAAFATLSPEPKQDCWLCWPSRSGWGGVRGPLMVNLQRMVASLVRRYQGEADRLEIPRACTSAGTGACGS